MDSLVEGEPPASPVRRSRERHVLDQLRHKSLGLLQETRVLDVVVVLDEFRDKRRKQFAHGVLVLLERRLVRRLAEDAVSAEQEQRRGGRDLVQHTCGQGEV